MLYKFQKTEKCEMCGAPFIEFKTLGKRLNKSQGVNPLRKIGITVTIQQCTSCDLIFSNPMPIPYSLQDHYGVPPENYWVDNYFTVDENYFRGVINWLASYKDITPGLKALDIGAGIGKCMIALERSGFDVYGIEPSIPFYERALNKMNIPASKIQNKAIEDAHFESETFDFITFGAVLEHLYNPGKAIEKAVVWLKPGGIIHIEVPSAHWLTNKLINRIYKLKGTDYVANLSPMHEPYHLYEFGLKSFQKHATNHNYTIADHRYIVCDTFLPKSLDFILKPYMKSTDKGMQLALLLRKNS
jgi:2-polyprenyl-3-methyl-5-hydroxy-6-metoxy-1,4-benzoquinol methylase